MSESTTSPEKLFGDIAQFIADSRALLEAGAWIELAGLDDQVRSLCDAVLQLSPGQRLQHGERLQHVLADLQALGEALAAQRDKVAGEIRSVSHHKKAVVAYRTVDASDANKSDDEEDK